MQRSRTFLVSLLLCSLMAVLQAEGGNLPQLKVTVAIKGKQHQALRAYARTLDGTPDELPPPIEQILLSALPKQFRKGCTQMIAAWGTTARKTETLLPRPLYLATMPDSSWHLLLAYTCFSTAAAYGDRYYDERLAALTVGKSSSTLTMLPLSRECSTCSELSHLGLQDDTLRIGGALGITIAAGMTNDNPCCGAAASIDEKHLHYFLIDARGITPVASMLEYRKETDHKEGEDSTTVYTVKRYLEKASGGNVTKIVGQYEITVNDELTKRGIVEMVWNAKRKLFDETRR